MARVVECRALGRQYRYSKGHVMRQQGLKWTAAAATGVLLGQCAVAAAASAAPAPAAYTITDLGVLGAGDNSVATAVNNAGEVVGYNMTSTGLTHAFRWRRGVISDLGTEQGGSSSTAAAINDAGQVAGTADRTGGGYGYPARWSATGVLTDLGGAATNALGAGTGVDPGGRVVGGQRPATSEGEPLGTLYQADGTRVDLGANLGLARGINAVGQVVGSPAYVWQAGSVRFLPGFPSAGAAIANAINISGQVVGSASAGNNLLAVRWQNGNPVTLGTVSGINYNQATAVNAAGDIVGTADPLCSPCVSARGWLWRAGSLVPLDDLLPAGSGWVLQQANGINDRGQIVGAGLRDGHVRAFLLTPTFSVSINFAPAGSAVPVGYLADTGTAYGTRGSYTYGWDVDNTVNARDRNSVRSPDQRYDTLTHMQKAGGASRWELAVPNGRYAVHVVAGDPDNVDSTYRLTVEGQLAASGIPTAAQHWIEGKVTVTVTDGRLTIGNAADAVNDKLAYVDVVSA
jgi:probable HAF family extracellular repeat protein